jgi:hypothetical protein
MEFMLKNDDKYVEGAGEGSTKSQTLNPKQARNSKSKRRREK